MAHTTRWIKLTAVTMLLTTAPALSATARPDPGSPGESSGTKPCIAPAPLDGRIIAEERCAAAAARAHALSYEPNCPLRRVGDHLVRCDNLTGAGVPAPIWVPAY
jgi:hypothetical protein